MYVFNKKYKAIIFLGSRISSKEKLLFVQFSSSRTVNVFLDLLKNVKYALEKYNAVLSIEFEALIIICMHSAYLSSPFVQYVMIIVIVQAEKITKTS